MKLFCLLITNIFIPYWNKGINSGCKFRLKIGCSNSSRALFNFEKENAVFEKGDPDAYREYQKSILDEAAGIGAAFSLVKNFSHFMKTANTVLKDWPDSASGLCALIEWNIEVDEAMFLAGLNKVPLLAEIEPDFFFKDQTGHFIAYG